MEVKLNQDKSIFVDFFYDQPEREAHLKKYLGKTDTYAQIYLTRDDYMNRNKENKMANTKLPGAIFGVTSHHLVDTFRKSEGRKRALSKALSQLTDLPKADRVAFWLDYFKITNEKIAFKTEKPRKSPKKEVVDIA